jgi:hypothetical protein
MHVWYGGKGDLGDAKLKRGDETAGEEAEEAGSNFAARVSIVALIMHALRNIASEIHLLWTTWKRRRETRRSTRGNRGGRRTWMGWVMDECSGVLR